MIISDEESAPEIETLIRTQSDLINAVSDFLSASKNDKEADGK